MTALRASLTGRNRALALWIVACALMLRIVVPAGWMPMTGADGLTRIQLCTGQGMVEAFVDRTTGAIHEKAPAKPGKTGQPCAFAGLAFAFDAPALPLLAAPARIAAIGAVAHVFAIIPGRGLAAPPPPATGPPLPF